MEDRNILRATGYPRIKTRPESDFLTCDVARRVNAGSAEAERIVNVALMSGALIGEFEIRWHWRRGIGAWPYLC